MTQPAKSQEPSMEEILASIRRIIADDDASKTAPKPVEAKPAGRAAAPPRSPAPAAPPPVADTAARAAEIDVEELEDPGQPAAAGSADLQDPDILDLSESTQPANPQPMAQPAFPQPAPMPGAALQSAKIEHFSDASFDQAEDKPAAPPRDEEPAIHFAHEAIEEAEVDDHDGDRESGLLLSNATTAAVDSAFNALAQTVLVHNARTLEDLVREMLRPMLKTWLDDNLPGLVERLVRAEIERVARGR
jgi:uncharacterized protein